MNRPGEDRRRAAEERGACVGAHRWEEVGGRLVCRDCHLIDFTWSLWRRRMVAALRAAGSPPHRS